MRDSILITIGAIGGTIASYLGGWGIQKVEEIPKRHTKQPYRIQRHHQKMHDDSHGFNRVSTGLCHRLALCTLRRHHRVSDQ